MHGRMQADLRNSMQRFSQDFDREITRIFLSFQIKAAASQKESEAAYAECYSHWTAIVPHPQLVGAIYSVTAGKESMRLSRFDPETGLLEPSVWPSEFAKLRRTLEQNPRSVPGVEFKASAQTTGGTPKIIAEEIPALIVPILPAPRSERRESTGDVYSLGLSYTVVQLNLDYIRQELIPILVQRHFSSSEGMDYRIVIGNDEGKVIYQSDRSESSVSFAFSDASTNLFSVLSGESENLLIIAAPTALDRSGQKELHQRKLGPSGLESHQTSQRSSMPSQPSAEYVPVTMATAKGEDQNDPKAESDGRWQLRVKHAAGSLELAAAQVRRRNLLLSFGILLVLSTGMIMIIMSSFRMQRLTLQQMEFVAGVSHDLRTPVAILCSASENLADGTIRGQEQVIQYGEMLKNESYQLAEMVEQVLEFAGATSPQKAFKLYPVVVPNVVERALAACQSQTQEKGFTIEKYLEPYLPHVLADEADLARAIQNLLSNAMKYSGENRWVGLRVQAGTHKRRAEVKITITDQGSGIQPSDLPRIFEPFRRGRSESVMQTHGSGLGLSLVKRIIEAYGGRVSVQSTIGHGSAFTLHLPALTKSA